MRELPSIAFDAPSSKAVKNDSISTFSDAPLAFSLTAALERGLFCLPSLSQHAAS
jgi:hypothetical protein